MTATAVLSDDGREFTLTKGMWSRRFPVAELTAQIRFYRSLCEVPATKSKPAHTTKCAWAYLPTLAALQALARQIDARGGAV